jgi:hypothetical protein
MNVMIIDEDVDEHLPQRKIFFRVNFTNFQFFHFNQLGVVPKPKNEIKETTPCNRMALRCNLLRSNNGRFDSSGMRKFSRHGTLCIRSRSPHATNASHSSTNAGSGRTISISSLPLCTLSDPTATKDAQQHTTSLVSISAVEWKSRWK